MAQADPGELQTVVATLQTIAQQIGAVAKAVNGGAFAFATAYSAASPPSVTLSAEAPTGPVAGYLSVNLNGTIVKVPYYES